MVEIKELRTADTSQQPSLQLLFHVNSFILIPVIFTTSQHLFNLLIVERCGIVFNGLNKAEYFSRAVETCLSLYLIIVWS